VELGATNCRDPHRGAAEPAIGGGRGWAPAALPQSRAPLRASASCKVTPAGPKRRAAPIRRLPLSFKMQAGTAPRSPPNAGSAATQRRETLHGRTAVRETERPKELVHARQQRGSPQTPKAQTGWVASLTGTILTRYEAGAPWNAGVPTYRLSLEHYGLRAGRIDASTPQQARPMVVGSGLIEV